MLLLRKNLEPMKVAAHYDIDVAAGEVRKLYITATPGQEMLYQQKRAEAEMVCSNPEIDPVYTPHIAREALANGVSLLDQAAVVLTMANQWMVISSIIEDMRLAAKKAVTAATTPAEIKQAATIEWSVVYP